MRIVVRARAASGMRTASSSSMAARARPASPRGRARRSVSAIWSPTVNTGFSAVIGSWKMSAMPAPRTAPHLALGERQQVAALEIDAPAEDAAGRLHSRRIESAVTDLPLPDSPTSPSVSPAPHRRS